LFTVSLFHSLINREDGQALPEFALVLPILIVVFMGIIHFGKAFNYWNDTTHITAEGARYAAVNNKPYPLNPASLQAQLLAQGDTPELRNGGTADVPVASQVCIDFPTGTAAKGEPVRVTMTFRYNWLSLFDLDVASTTITSTAVMRLETAPTNYSAGCV
jgi:Flp pilus assembly protein TadG